MATTHRIVILLVTITANLAVAEHPRGMHSTADLSAIRAKVIAGKEPWLTAYKDLIVRANKALQFVSQPVADFDVPGYYGNRQEQHVKMKTFLAEETSAAYASALAYNLAVKADTVKRLSYGRKAAEILKKWAAVNKTVSGADGNLVMSYNGNKMAVAGDLIYSSTLWTETERAAFASWVRNVLLKNGDAIDTRSNNWGDWGTLAVIVSCCFLDDNARLAGMVAQVRGRVLGHIAADGHLGAETGRGGNGMWYTYFALAPMTEACFILERVAGADLFSLQQSSGQRIKKALDFFLPYCKNPASWPYATVTNLPNATSPQGWPGNLYEAMADVYGNQEYEAYAAKGRPHFRNSTGLAWVASTLCRGTYKPNPTSSVPKMQVESRKTPQSAIRIDLFGSSLVAGKPNMLLNGCSFSSPESQSSLVRVLGATRQ